MTAPPVTIRAKASVAEAARTMLKRHIHRLPVVERGELVGIVTRSDLVRAFARPDAEIAAEIVEDVLERTLWLDPGAVHVVVAEGEVVLSGEVATRTTADLAPAFVARVPGVVDVRSDLTWRVDDRAVRHSIYADRL